MAVLITVLAAAGLAGLAGVVKVMRLPAGSRVRYNLLVVPTRRLWGWMDEPHGWQARHFAVAPFGGTLSTWFWTLVLDSAGAGAGMPAPGIWSEMAQLASWGALTYGMFAVGAEGVVQMFYAIAKRRRDLNAAEDKGHEKGVLEGREEGRIEGHERGVVEGREEGVVEGHERGLEEGIQRGVTALDAVAARLGEPGADPMAVIAQLRAELRNGAGH